MEHYRYTIFTSRVINWFCPCAVAVGEYLRYDQHSSGIWHTVHIGDYCTLKEN